MVKAGDVAFLPAESAGCISRSSTVKWLHINRRKPEENKSSRHNNVELRVYVYVCVCWCVVRVCTDFRAKKMSCE